MPVAASSVKESTLMSNCSWNDDLAIEMKTIAGMDR